MSSAQIRWNFFAGFLKWSEGILSCTLQVDDVNGFDDTLVTPFRERIEANGMSVDDLDMVRQLVLHYFNLFFKTEQKQQMEFHWNDGF